MAIAIAALARNSPHAREMTARNGVTFADTAQCERAVWRLVVWDTAQLKICHVSSFSACPPAV